MAFGPTAASSCWSSTADATNPSVVWNVHGESFGAWERAWRRRPWLAALFGRQSWRVEARWRPRRIAYAPRFAEQYRELIRCAGGPPGFVCEFRFTANFGQR